MIMQKLKWTAECRLGNDEIDSQHRLLFAIANELIEIENPKMQAPEMKYLLNHLKNYIETHFAFEEKFMQELKYPGFDEHKKKHDTINRELFETIKQSQTFTELKSNLDTLLDMWIRTHILMEDKKYSNWCKSHGIL